MCACFKWQFVVHDKSHLFFKVVPFQFYIKVPDNPECIPQKNCGERVRRDSLSIVTMCFIESIFERLV